MMTTVDIATVLLEIQNLMATAANIMKCLQESQKDGNDTINKNLALTTVWYVEWFSGIRQRWQLWVKTLEFESSLLHVTPTAYHKGGTAQHRFIVYSVVVIGGVAQNSDTSGTARDTLDGNLPFTKIEPNAGISLFLDTKEPLYQSLMWYVEWFSSIQHPPYPSPRTQPTNSNK